MKDGVKRKVIVMILSNFPYDRLDHKTDEVKRYDSEIFSLQSYGSKEKEIYRHYKYTL